jgi:hypothetical protein
VCDGTGVLHVQNPSKRVKLRSVKHDQDSRIILINSCAYICCASTRGPCLLHSSVSISLFCIVSCQCQFTP